MAELLVMNQDQGPQPNHHKKGQVILVRYDGFNWKPAERIAPFRVIKAPGVPVQKLYYLLRSEQQQRLIDNPKDLLADYEVNPNLGHRSHGIDPDKIPHCFITMEHIWQAEFRFLPANNDRIIG